MSKDPAIYTRTMANVFFQQGHYGRAIEIYRYLLKRQPNQPDIIEALKEAEKQQELQAKAGANDLVQLVSEWIELLQKYRLIRKLNRLWEKKK